MGSEPGQPLLGGAAQQPRRGLDMTMQSQNVPLSGKSSGRKRGASGWAAAIWMQARHAGAVADGSGTHGLGCAPKNQSFWDRPDLTACDTPPCRCWAARPTSAFVFAAATQQLSGFHLRAVCGGNGKHRGSLIADWRATFLLSAQIQVNPEHR
jgi:hypothetical protein